jgi:hypothetical protein
MSKGMSRIRKVSVLPEQSMFQKGKRVLSTERILHEKNRAARGPLHFNLFQVIFGNLKNRVARDPLHFNLFQVIFGNLKNRVARDPLHFNLFQVIFGNLKNNYMLFSLVHTITMHIKL